MNEEKKADNSILDNKVRINKIDLEVDKNKKLLESLDEIEENFSALKKNIDNCIQLSIFFLRAEKFSSISSNDSSSFLFLSTSKSILLILTLLSNILLSAFFSSFIFLS